MKRVFLFCCLSAFLIISCGRNYSRDPLTLTISGESARKDFTLCREVLEAAHPSLTLYHNKQRITYLFDSVYSTLTKRLTLRELFNKFYFLTNEAGCSHTDFFLPSYVYDTLENRNYFFPLPVLLVENKLLVNTLDGQLSEGTEIVSVNGIPSQQILNNISLYNSVEGFHRHGQLIMASRDFAFQYYLKYGAKDEFEINYTDTPGKQKSITLDAVSFNDWNYQNKNNRYYFDDTNVDYDLRINNEKQYAVLRVATFDYEGEAKDAAFKRFCENSFDLLKRKNNINSLIVDLRDNGGGRLNCLFYLFSFLAEKQFVEYDRVVSRIDRIPYRQYSFLSIEETNELNNTLKNEFGKKSNGYYYYADSLINTWEPNENHFAGKVFVVTNERTVSAASYLALLTKRSGRGKVIGEETAGGSYSGNGFTSLAYSLPGSGIRLFFPYAHMVYSYKDEKNTGRGVVPDYIVPDTYESFKNNEDKQISYIIDSLILK